MTKQELKYRRVELEKQASGLLNHDRDGFKKLTQEKQGELQKILLEMIGLDMKITSPDPNIKSPVPWTRRKKKHSNNSKQLILF